MNAGHSDVEVLALLAKLEAVVVVEAAKRKLVISAEVGVLR